MRLNTNHYTLYAIFATSGKKKRIIEANRVTTLQKESKSISSDLARCVKNEGASVLYRSWGKICYELVEKRTNPTALAREIILFYFCEHTHHATHLRLVVREGEQRV